MGGDSIRANMAYSYDYEMYIIGAKTAVSQYHRLRITNDDTRDTRELCTDLAGVRIRFQHRPGLADPEAHSDRTARLQQDSAPDLRYRPSDARHECDCSTGIPMLQSHI